MTWKKTNSVFDDKNIIDPIYGQIQIEEPIVKEIILSPQFTRLAHIKQLSFANIQYYSANHTRFEHSLGTYHICKKFAHRLKLHDLAGKEIEQYYEELLLAALLHDVGHAPYSHTVEQALSESGSSRHYRHEDYSEKIILGDFTNLRPSIHGILKDYENKKLDLNLIAYIATGKKKYFTLDPNLLFLTDIITGDAGADRIDYLLRDSYHSGVKYGLIQTNELIQELSIITDSEDRKRLAFEYNTDRKGVYAPSDLLIARYYHFANLVYQPKIRAANAMFKRCLIDYLTICEERNEFIKKLFTFYDDYTLLHELMLNGNRAIRKRIEQLRKGQLIGFNSKKHNENNVVLYIDDLTPDFIFSLSQIIKFPKIKSNFINKVEAKIRRNNKGLRNIIFDLSMNSTSGMPVELFIDHEDEARFRSILIADKSKLIIELSRSLCLMGLLSIFSDTKFNFNLYDDCGVLLNNSMRQLRSNNFIFPEIILVILELAIDILANNLSKKGNFIKILIPGLSRFLRYINTILVVIENKLDDKIKIKTIRDYMTYNISRNNGAHGFIFYDKIYKDLLLLNGIGLIEIDLTPNPDDISSHWKWNFTVTACGKEYLEKINYKKTYVEWIPSIKNTLLQLIHRDIRFINSSII